MTTVAACMAEEQIPEEYAGEMQRLAEFLNVPTRAAPTESDDDPEHGRRERRKLRRTARAARIANEYQDAYGITPDVWIALSVYVLRFILRWWRGG